MKVKSMKKKLQKIIINHESRESRELLNESPGLKMEPTVMDFKTPKPSLNQIISPNATKQQMFLEMMK
jgi:hypothetical protein